MKFRTDEEKYHNLKLLTRLQLKKKSWMQSSSLRLSNRKNLKLTHDLFTREVHKNLGALTETAFFDPINSL